MINHTHKLIPLDGRRTNYTADSLCQPITAGLWCSYFYLVNERPSTHTLTQATYTGRYQWHCPADTHTQSQNTVHTYGSGAITVGVHKLIRSKKKKKTSLLISFL